MDGIGFYTPILKGSECDLRALGRTPKSFAPRMRPLIEMLSGELEEPLEDLCVSFAESVRKSCPFHTLSLDLHAIAPAERIHGIPAYEALCAYLRGVGVRYIPVLGFDHEPELWPRVAAVAKREQRGLTFRLRADDLEAADDTIAEMVSLLDDFDLSAAATDLVIDLGAIGSLDHAQIAGLRERTQDFIERAVSARKFRAITVAGSSMPKDVSEVEREGEKAIPRAELHLWLDAAGSLKRLPIHFGDYGVVHPNFSLKTPAPNANAKIRYTRGPHHYIFRGDSLKRLGYKQFHGLAKRVVDSRVFVGANYSHGDEYVWRCSRREERTGNLGTWVEVDMNHHMVYVTDHVQQMLAKIAAGGTVSEALAVA